MTGTTMVSICGLAVALWALLVSRATARATDAQAKAASSANHYAEKVGQSQAVIHFTARFFDLLQEGEKFDDTKWSYQFWSLHATEFYFFDNGWIPRFMYGLWMAELGSAYCSKPEAWKSHSAYLDRYATMYPRMYKFFQEVQRIAAADATNVEMRNHAIGEYVAGFALAPVDTIIPSP